MASMFGAGGGDGGGGVGVDTYNSNVASDPFSMYRKPSQQQSFYNNSSVTFQSDSVYDANKWTNSAKPNVEMYKKSSTNDNFQQQSNYMNGYQSAPQMQMNSNENYQRSPRREATDLRADVDMMNKQAYKRALDQQIAEKEILKYTQERDRKQTELNSINQYPFGRRTDPSSYIYDQQPSYQPSSNYNNNNNNQQMYEMSRSPIRLNKDNIVEKPNSLSADIPPYDPIKHRSGFHQGYNYDPWGKPGGGAPLVDANTGRKFTKISGQVWYDTLGVTPDERARQYQDKNRPLTLEEQKREIEKEKQRKRMEDHLYKQRAGDVASWITDLEDQRKAHNQYGAHLVHTNVTREKINLEYARRNNVNDSTKIYHDELGSQLEERNRQNKLHKLKDDVAGIEHTRKWDDWWGKPGGGAPNTDTRRRDLKETLESPRSRNHSTDPSFNGTSLPLSISQPKLNDTENANLVFAKGTRRSNHKNLYDNQQAMKL